VRQVVFGGAARYHSEKNSFEKIRLLLCLSERNNEEVEELAAEVVEPQDEKVEIGE
jgi:hypothetical protein